MASAGCRIGRVRHKATGQELRVIPRTRATGLAADLVEHSANVAHNFPHDMAAFIVIGVKGDGTYSASWRTSEDYTMGGMMFAAFVNEIVRREIMTSSEIKWFCKQQGWIG